MYTFRVDGVHPLSKRSCRNDLVQKPQVTESSFLALHQDAKTLLFLEHKVTWSTGLLLPQSYPRTFVAYSMSALRSDLSDMQVL